MQTKAAAIGVDWGSTRLRVFLFNTEGVVIDSSTSDDGILSINKRFAVVLKKHIDTWQTQYGTLPIVISGMAGSKNGWHEAPYRVCPIDYRDIVNNPIGVELEGLHLHFVAGLSCSGLHTQHGDVMRGEETQIVGAMRLDNQSSAVFCLPGTHSKWALIENNEIRYFRTYMTGEMFSLLSHHGLLSTSLDQQSAWDELAFAEGVRQSQQHGGLLSQLFQIRTGDVLAAHSKSYLTAFLSGLLIGHELQCAKSEYSINEVVFVGDTKLVEKYQSAFTQIGANSRTISGNDAVAAGLWLAAQAIILEQNV